MLLSGEGLCRFHAASTAAQVSGAVVSLPVRGLRLNWCFLIFSASSYAADGNGRRLESLEPEHRPGPLLDPAVVLLNQVIQILASVHKYLRICDLCQELASGFTAR
jgi:hypothetical protein